MTTVPTTATRERRELLADLSAQLPRVSERGRERTIRAIRQVEIEIAPGRAREREVVNGR